MARRTSYVYRASVGVWGLIGTLFGGLYLILLYLFTVWAVVGSLSAILVRDRLVTATQQEGITFAEVQDAQQRFFAQADQAWETLNDADSLNMELLEIQAAIQRKVEQIQALEPNPAVEPVAFEESVRFAEIVDPCVDAQFARPTPACKLVQQYFELRAEHDKLAALLEGVSFDALYAEALQKVEELRAKEPLAQFFQTYEFFGIMPLYKDFLHLPSEILILQLTMVMGVLGGVITMTWSFIRKDSGFTFRRFLILPVVGGMSAFVIFVFIKAGQLTLSAGNPADAAPLNPFALSFVGIISGLLSERAYARMAEVAGNFFLVNEEKPRFGIRLRAAMDEAGVGEDELAGYLRLSEEETVRILDEKAAAGPLHQQLIAACLRRPIRDIFTDLPPEAEARPAASPPPEEPPRQPPRPDMVGQPV
jgi:hypothetical protein